MKIRIETDGTVEIDVNGGDAQAAVRLIRQLQAEAAPAASVDRPAELTPRQAAVYAVLAEHPDGCHYTVVSDRLPGLTQAAANSRCQYLLQLGYAVRVRSGVYRVVT